MPSASRSSLVVFLGVFMPVIASAGCRWDVEVGAGERCSHEGWFGPYRVCPEGYSCDDSASWTCQPYSSGGGSTSPTSSTSATTYAPAPPKGDASVEIDASDGSSESDRAGEEDASPDATWDADDVPSPG
jgi:hypothetical protein